MDFFEMHPHWCDHHDIHAFSQGRHDDEAKRQKDQHSCDTFHYLTSF
ncbi:hypothetical protein JW752_05230 [Candidatus Peregrinibacteria bacterium]|nr:hypothetical protein [Candidatus Peregrinibacteria bacterium]